MAVLKELVERFERSSGDERYNYAQAICSLSRPEVQEEIDSVRREIMQHLDTEAKEKRCGRHNVAGCICGFKAQFVPRKLAKLGDKREWTKHQITPEISHDLTLTGLRVPKALVKRLQNALRAQHAIIARTVRILK